MDDLKTLFDAIPGWMKVASTLFGVAMGSWGSYYAVNARNAKKKAEAEKHNTDVVEQQAEQEEIKETSSVEKTRTGNLQDDVNILRRLLNEMQHEIIDMQKDHVSRIQEMTDQYERRIKSIRQEYDDQNALLKNEMIELHRSFHELEIEFQQVHRNSVTLSDQLDTALAEKEALKQAIAGKNLEILALKSRLNLDGDYRIRIRTQESRSKLMPCVWFDQCEKRLVIEGASLAENAYVDSAYKPILLLLTDYFERYSELAVEFRLTDCNTVSQRRIQAMIDFLNMQHENGRTITAVWYHEQNDNDWQEQGEIYADAAAFPFKIESTKQANAVVR